MENTFVYISNKKVLLIALAKLFGVLFMFHNTHEIDAGTTGAKQIFIMKLSTQPSTLRKAVNRFKNATPEQIDNYVNVFKDLTDDAFVMSQSKDVNKEGGYFFGPAGGDNTVTETDLQGNFISSFNMNIDPRATTLGAIKNAVKEAQEVGY